MRSTVRIGPGVLFRFISGNLLTRSCARREAVQRCDPDQSQHHEPRESDRSHVCEKSHLPDGQQLAAHLLLQLSKPFLAVSEHLALEHLHALDPTVQHQAGSE